MQHFTICRSGVFSINGLDLNSFHLPRVHLVQQMVKLLERERFVLISSSAASGKTSLLQLFMAKTKGTKCTYISLLEGGRNAFDLLKSAGVDLKDKVCKLGQNEGIVDVVMLDDSQNKYDETDFWKKLIKESPTWLPRNLSFVISATYMLSPSSESPVEFESLNRIARKDMLLGVDEYQVFMESPLGLPKTMGTPTILNVIWNECGGLIGAVRLSVQYILSIFNKDETPPESGILREYFSSKLVEGMVRCFGSTHSKPVSKDLENCLVNCFLGGIHWLAHPGEVEKTQLIQLKKCGILEVTGHGVGFTSPLARRFYAQLLFPNRSAESEKPNTLLGLTIKTIGSMSASLLRNSVTRSDSFPKEAVFQHLFMVALAQSTPPDCMIYPELSEVFPDPQAEIETIVPAPITRISGEIDFYLDGEYHWGIELLVKGDRIQEHVERFSRNGKYHALATEDHIIIDFRPCPVSKKIHRYTKKLTVFFENDFSKCFYLYGDVDEVAEITLSK
jgi:hypothetical protein